MAAHRSEAKEQAERYHHHTANTASITAITRRLGQCRIAREHGYRSVSLCRCYLLCPRGRPGCSYSQLAQPVSGLHASFDLG